MAAGNMLRLVQGFSALNIHTTSWNLCQRSISNKNLLEKLGLPEKPKRPLNGFIRFKNSVQEDLLKKNPNLTVIELSQIAGKLWKQCNQEEKNKLSEQFKKDFKIYKTLLENYETSLTREQKAEIREAEEDIKILKEQKLARQIRQKREQEFKKPKFPLSPFFRFVISQVRDKNKTRSEEMKKMSEKWLKLPDHEREKYSIIYAKEKEEYEKELELWEEEMIKMGNTDIVRTKTLKNKIRMFS